MKRNRNLPPHQRETQRHVDRFNADEKVWRDLEPKHRRRRALKPRLSAAHRKRLDQIEFAKALPPDDAIGLWKDR